METTQTKNSDACEIVLPISEKKLRSRVAAILGAIATVVLVWQGTYLSDSREALVQERKEREKIQQSFDEQLRRAELIIASAPVALIMCGEDRRITVCNPKADEMFGWEQDELLGQKIDVLLPASFIPQHEASFSRAILAAKNGPDNHMVRRVGLRSEARHKNGDLFPVVVTIRVIKYGGRLEFIASVGPVKTKPKTDAVPLPDIGKRRQAQKNFIEQ